MGTISSTNYRRIFLLNICPNFRINFFQDMEVQYRMLKRNKLKLKYTLRNIEVVHKSAIIFRIIFFWIIEDLRFQQYNDNIRLFHWIYDHSTQEVSTSWKIRGLPRVYYDVDTRRWNDCIFNGRLWKSIFLSYLISC